MKPRLSFLTLETPDVERTAAFYRDLGIELSAEQHGGPVHYAFTTAGPVEFYPVSENDGGNGVMLGLDTDDLDALLAKIDPVMILKPIQTVAGFRRFIVRDPDGRRVYVREVMPTS
ncbi:MAG: VOC family protein [Beijerinckiaceae bacterium]